MVSKRRKATKKDELLVELKSLLLEPHSFLTKQEAATAKTYLEIDTVDEWTKARRKETEQQQSFLSESSSSSRNNPLMRLNEGFEQWGDDANFKRFRALSD